ncbi:2-phosphosulfolactate phosphatase [candidate division KSB1 bacterium]
MKINVFTTPLEIQDYDLRGTNAAVIDVLRATSSMLYALYNGCKEIIPVESVERALSLRSALFDPDLLLCGEKNGLKVEGFDLGNSPFEYTADIISEKSLIFSSTNGTKAMVKARSGKSIYICGFVNISETSKKLSKENDPLNIICAGHNNRFSLEDTICAGMLVSKISECFKEEINLTDSAKSALILYKNHSKDLKTMITDSDHGKELDELGMERDLDFCVDVDNIPVTAVFSEGKIIKM